MQLFGRVAAVGIHLDEHRVVAAQTPRETRQVGRAEAVLRGAVHHVRAAGSAAASSSASSPVPSGLLSSTIEQVHVGARACAPPMDQRQVLPLVEGGDDHQDALAGAFPGPGAPAGRCSCSSSVSPEITRRSWAALVERSVVTALGRAASSSPPSSGGVSPDGRTGALRIRPGLGPKTNRTREPSIVPYTGQDDRSGRRDQDPLQHRAPAGRRRQLRLQAHLDVQVGGLEEVRARQLAHRPARSPH